jgi:F420-0:gamma-glutamyl ligase
MKRIGTMAIGIKAPIIREGDDLVSITSESLKKAQAEHGFAIDDRDVICITEAIVAKAQGNFVTVDDIASDLKRKFNHMKEDEPIGVVFPILSRNRFSLILKGIAKAFSRVVIQLSLPTDEVGNPLVGEEEYYNKSIDFLNQVMEESDFRSVFSKPLHPFTGVDYLEYYKEVVGEGAKVILSNNPQAILAYTPNVIVANIHKRAFTKKSLEKAGVKKVVTLDEIMNEPVGKSGYHPMYGVLGSNKATEEKLKLFPRDSQWLVEAVQKRVFQETGKKVEVMVYGDGAFKDPVGGIWELADPVVSPFHTAGLHGTPNEIKFKYVIDTALKGLTGSEEEKALKELILKKEASLVGKDVSLGTTPRRYIDLLGSLADLLGGSGDKGTPIILIKGYFDNYAS